MIALFGNLCIIIYTLKVKENENMISLLGESSGGGGNATLWILLVLLAVLIIAYIFSYFKRKKYNQETTNMLNSLKPGDKVKTYSGFYGTVVSIRETTDGKVVTLETGDEKHKSYTTIDSNAIYCIDKKEDIVYDADGNVIEPEDETTPIEAKAQKSEPVIEEASTEVADENALVKEENAASSENESTPTETTEVADSETAPKTDDVKVTVEEGDSPLEKEQKQAKKRSKKKK